jgi:hypothetical protein
MRAMPRSNEWHAGGFREGEQIMPENHCRTRGAQPRSSLTCCTRELCRHWRDFDRRGAVLFPAERAVRPCRSLRSRSHVLIATLMLSKFGVRLNTIGSFAIVGAAGATASLPDEQCTGSSRFR